MGIRKKKRLGTTDLAKSTDGNTRVTKCFKVKKNVEETYNIILSNIYHLNQVHQESVFIINAIVIRSNFAINYFCRDREQPNSCFKKVAFFQVRDHS